MNGAAFLVVAVFLLATALAAALLPRLIHAALAFALAFIAVAAFYFSLGAEFVGLIQVFVYVGAVAVLIVFTILLTRRDSSSRPGFNWSGLGIAVAVFATLAWSILKTPALAITAPGSPHLSVREIGQALMLDYVWPLQCVGVLLTVALLGALILAMEQKQ